MKSNSTPSRHVGAKIQALRQSGTLNLRARKVLDRLFLEEDFFDPEDLPQVKYEMLRRVQKETMPIGTAAASFGFSRPSFYKALEDFAREGLVGLIPKKRGPKGGHKLTGEIMAFVDQTRAQEPSVRTSDLVRRIQKQFGTRVHRRTLERALIAAKKNRPNASLADEYGC
jgi:transposase